MHRIIVFLILSCTALVLPQSIAAKIIFEDTFDQGIGSWAPVRDSGQFWLAKDGYIEAFIPMGSRISELMPTHWDNEPSHHYQYDIEYLPIQGGDRVLSFSVRDTNNWYQIHFAPYLTMAAKVVDNVLVWSEQVPYILQNGQTYQIKIIFDHGKISLTIDGTEIATFEDPKYAGETGVISLRAGTGAIYPARVRFESVRVTDLSEDTLLPHGGKKLDISLLKQTDPRWANLEYNTASVWVDDYPPALPTFSDWACNLVSQVMIMQYHGITTLPDGSELTPISYNTWLLENQGFLRSPHTGNISRLSASQLSAANSAVHATPKLEFNYHPAPSLEAIAAEIDAGRPAILELDGHFVVAEGYTDSGDIYIADPSYPIELLSEHSLPLRSMRTYYPTHSDLSYLEIISDTEAIITLTQKDQPVGTQSTEYLRAARLNEDIIGPELQSTFLAKPPTGQYLIQMLNTSDTDQLAQARLTDQAGEFLLNQELALSPGLHQYSLTYEDAMATLEEIIEPEPEPEYTPPAETTSTDWQAFRHAVLSLHSEQFIKRHSLAKSLLKIPTLLENARTPYISSILTQMALLLLENVPASAISDAARKELIDLLKHLTSV